MEYKCQICTSFKTKTNCSHIFHLGNSEFSITNIYCDEGGSKLLVKDLNCDCLKKTYYVNKFEICSCCLKQNIDYICLECDDRFCVPCVNSGEIPGHVKYETIWKESKCLQNSSDDKNIHYLIHYRFNRIHNNFYLLFKDVITIVNKIHYLRLFKIKGTEEFIKYKNIFEKSTSSIFDDLNTFKQFNNLSKFNTLSMMASNIEKQTNKLPFAAKNSEMIIDFKEYIDEEGMLCKKDYYEGEYINMVVMSQEKIRILLTNRIKVISATINQDASSNLVDYSSEFTKIIGMFAKANNQISFFIQNTSSSNHTNNYNLTNNNSSVYHTDVVDYKFDNTSLKKVSSYKLNYVQSVITSNLINSNQKESKDGHSSSSNLLQHLLSFEKKMKNALYVQNYLICCFNYGSFNTIEIFQQSTSDNKYNLIKMLTYIDEIYLLYAYISNNSPLYVVSFKDKTEIYNISKNESVHILNSLDFCFKFIQIKENNYFLCDNFQIYKLKEDKNCLLNTHCVFVNDSIIDMCSYKDYLLVLTSSSSIRIYYKYDLVYLQTVKLSKNVRLIRSFLYNNDEFVVFLSVDMKLSMMRFNGLKDLSENIIDINTSA